MSAAAPFPVGRRTLGRLLLGAALLVTEAGFTTQPMTAAQKKLAEHYTNNDPIWSVFRQAAVGEDRAKGLLTAAFTPEITAMSGKALKVSGFMTPLEPRTTLRHFILTRRSTTCPFCPPNEPTEAVEVRLDTPIAVTDQEVTVTGRLELVAASDEGLFYRLAAATPAKPG